MDPFSETDEDELSTVFARELANGMESLMRELVDQPDQDREITGGASEGRKEMTEEERKAFKAAWEAMMIEGLGGPTSSEEGLDKGRASEETGTFQSKIKQTIDKLKENESKFQVCCSLFIRLNY
jgi:peroxin-19